MKILTIGQLAKQAGVNIETIRYYERRKLIPEPPRRESGYRQYSLNYVRRIRFIKQAQAVGFSLTEIAELMALRLGPETPNDEVRKQAEAKIVDIETKLQRLYQVEQALYEVISACDEGRQTGSDPMIEALASDT